MTNPVQTKLDVRIYEDRKSMGAAASEKFAKEITALLKTKDEINVVFAAAPSQNEFLAALDYENLDWSRVNAFHMDEYIGLAADATQGFGNFLKHRLFDKFNFKSVNYLNGNAADIAVECERYTALLTQNKVDVVCMGIGENGHLAFNDPPVADFEDKYTVKIVELDEVCRQQQVNDGCFVALDEVPTEALTLTIPALLSATYINCVVPGPTKAEAVNHTLNSEISTENPATILRTHSNAVLFLDKDSSKLLNS
ncbi:glucosamine-6-phosphate deaminase [Pedobacter xixiisoli]|uniref:Glucosamine-6-phosphate deaminase n=1 Tax=Pedobacter xixiisoli TaxID=1476464 RepID=A0A285ZS71_9SPHI|nr:glucosamine-6-phosphate deaminase [Pedobacter xixiisoli]SOD12491.1 glucosamine-6-phosphate deaminase [Pedobacter xixiisoli]